MTSLFLQRARIIGHAALALTTVGLVACDPDGYGTSQAVTAPDAAHAAHQAAITDGSARLGRDVLAALASLRAATAPYHALDAAMAAGYRTRVTECMSSIAGGMGIHYADLDRFDATIEADRPELLVYAPGPQGRLRLVAVEYAVPLAAWTQPEPPTLFGVPFHVNRAFGLWVLHAWVWAPNPAGMFADWNPRITCPPDAA